MNRLRGWRLDLVWSLLLAVVILGPALLGIGYVLHGDLVFVPDQPWKAAWLGLDGQAPRSAPMDAVVWATTLALPGWLVERLFLGGALVLAGVGAGRLVREHAWPARLAAITFFVWNPWVHERLGIGQWALVAGYACLPWLARAAARWRDDPRAWAPVLAWLVASAVCGPSAGVLATVLVVAATALSGVRRAVAAAGLGVLANLPWLLPSLLLPGGLHPSGSAYAAFAPRAESAAGVIASAVSLGGVWKTSILAGERTSSLVVLVSCAVTLAAVAGWRAAAHDADRRLVTALAATGSVALAVTLLTTVPAVQDALDSAARQVPGLAMFRDSHRLLSLLAVALVPGVAAAVATLLRWATQDREALRAVAALLAAAPVLLLPSLAWGLFGQLEPVRWPGEWHQVAQLIGPHDRTVVLPWAGSYRGFVWNDHQASLDPAPRQMPGDVLIDDRVFLHGVTLAGESAELEPIADALVQTDAAAALRALGIRWVLVEHDTGKVGPIPSGTTSFEGDDLTLVDLGAPEAYDPGRPPAVLVIGGDLVTILVLSCGLFLHYRRVR